MKRLACLAMYLLLLTPSLLFAEDDPQAKFGVQVDKFEIERWGNRVSVCGDGIQDGGDSLFAMAMAPPIDDNDMFFVTVWGPSNDPGTLAVVKEFERGPYLARYVASPPTGGKPWAHFNFIHSDDVMQKFRFEDAQIPLTGPWPVITLHPPLNDHHGPHNICIDKVPAGEIQSPAQLAQRISASVDLWTKKLRESNYIPPQQALAEFYGAPSSSSHKQTTYPWGPTTPPAATPVTPMWPVGGPAAVPAAPTGGGGGILDWLISPQAGTFYLLLIAGLRVWENIAPKFGFKGDVAKMLGEFLQMLKPTTPTPATPTPATPNTVPPGMVVVKNPSGEGYILVPMPQPNALVK